LRPFPAGARDTPVRARDIPVTFGTLAAGWRRPARGCGEESSVLTSFSPTPRKAPSDFDQLSRRRLRPVTLATHKTRFRHGRAVPEPARSTGRAVPEPARSTTRTADPA